jgi:hypothetical protein
MTEQCGPLPLIFQISESYFWTFCRTCWWELANYKASPTKNNKNTEENADINSCLECDLIYDPCVQAVEDNTYL